MRYLIYVPECSRAPASILLKDIDSGIKCVLDENLSPALCFNSRGERVKRVKLELNGNETTVVGWTAGEVLASYLKARFVDERKARFLIKKDYRELLDALAEAATKIQNSFEAVLEGTILIVVPGSLVETKAWGAAIAVEALDKPRILGRFTFNEIFETKSSIVYHPEVFDRFGNWWQVPWEIIFSAGRSLRRYVEFLSERPVERIPSTLLGKKKVKIKELVREVLKLAQTEEYEVYGRREISKSAVYIEGNLVGLPSTIVAVLVQRNSFRKIRARWYFNEDLDLVGYDVEPPDATRRLDSIFTIGKVEIEGGKRIPESLTPLLKRLALRSPVRQEDYMAVKTLRWYEISKI